MKADPNPPHWFKYGLYSFIFIESFCQKLRNQMGTVSKPNSLDTVYTVRFCFIDTVVKKRPGLFDFLLY
jgi:hypothetical protein